MIIIRFYLALKCLTLLMNFVYSLLIETEWLHSSWFHLPTVDVQLSWSGAPHFSSIELLLHLVLRNGNKQRQSVSAGSVFMIYRTISIVEYVAKIGRGIMEWISSVHQKCVCTMVILFSKQRLEKKKKKKEEYLDWKFCWNLATRG